MKKIILIFFVLLFEKSQAQNSLLRKDKTNLAERIMEKNPWNKDEIKNISTEIFFVLINVKDSVFAGLEVLSKNNSVIASSLENKLPQIFQGFKFQSCKEKFFILPLVVINQAKYSDKYIALKNKKDYPIDSSYYLGAIISLINPSPNQQ